MSNRRHFGRKTEKRLLREPFDNDFNESDNNADRYPSQPRVWHSDGHPRLDRYLAGFILYSKDHVLLVDLDYYLQHPLTIAL